MKQVDVTRVPNMEGRREAERLYTAYLELDKVADDAETEARKKAEGDTGATQAREKAKAAYEAYNESDCPALDTDDDGEIRRCALSGRAVGLMRDGSL